jgi:SAM-dependent methyltransferase
MLAERGCAVGHGSMLDFGCGVGRLTQAFAAYFERCEGVDIAEGMVTRARALNARTDRVRYRLGEPDRIAFADGTFDLVYSRIVLQHMPVELQARFVAEFIRVIVPGGFAVFQAPSMSLVDPGTVFRSPVDTPDGIVTIDMNVFSRAAVEGAIVNAGGRLVSAWEDRAAGPKFESHTYVATRDLSAPG